ncbi:MAG TPA: PEGA domain-containing protein [Pseudomonadales bacterium]|jgi:hypothetical protein
MRNLLLISALMVLSTGCATITRGTNEAFAIQTDPAGADARLSNGLSCVTPCSVKVKRRGDFVVTITKDGYETVNASVSSSVDGGGAAGMAGNVILGGIIGAGVDAGTGAMHSHKPNPLVVKLTPLDPHKTDDRDAANDEVAVGTNSVLKDKNVQP